MFTGADYVILSVIGISALLSLLRGFIKEAVSLLAWGSAFVITGKFYPLLAEKLTFSQDELTRNIIAIILIFVVTLLIVGMIGSVIKALIHKAGLSAMDRALGVIFGLGRGILVCCAVLSMIQFLTRLNILTFLQQHSWWTQSVLIPELNRIILWFFNYFDASQGAV